MACEHVNLIVSGDLLLSFTDMDAFVRQIDTLSVRCGRFSSAQRSQLCGAMHAAGKKLVLTEGFTPRQSCWQHVEFFGDASALWHADADLMTCCCRACPACLHREGKAQFLEAA